MLRRLLILFTCIGAVQFLWSEPDPKTTFDFTTFMYKETKLRQEHDDAFHAYLKGKKLAYSQMYERNLMLRQLTPDQVYEWERNPDQSDAALNNFLILGRLECRSDDQTQQASTQKSKHSPAKHIFFGILFVLAFAGYLIWSRNK